MTWRLISVQPETASFGPGRRFRFFCNPRNSPTIPDEDPELSSGWLQKRSGLALNQNLLFPDGHLIAYPAYEIISAIFPNAIEYPLTPSPLS
jgi:hypothetical protein